ncbi:MAG: DUF3343 domain-containing protein [Bacillota bacterium]|uniref:Putative Se/S carrier protein-like domain-containing protein n=1 Tax=[Clostridium] aminophilum TaxID=1526 RepID=A0A1I6IRP1_9FIRM|nr:DUF3343 domain-containing protein [[Clostridium] aminophilum]MDT3843991.1 DUF3343 domain-containing protein [Bacillota bacterium]SFR69388.1 Protein of unknown function [[Clostridium] aminophilum]
MREKKDYIILTFSTTRSAMRFEAFAAEKGIPGRTIPVPREISAGCGIAWRMDVGAYGNCRETIRSGGISPEKVTAVRM